MKTVEKLGAFDKTYVQLNEAVRNVILSYSRSQRILIRDALAIMRTN
jgi:hypothetical protein